MKKIFVFLFVLFFNASCFAYQCPEYADFYQDDQNVWHLTKIPLAPPGTYWAPLTQGALAPKIHEVNGIDVGLTMGTWPFRVQCTYSRNGAIFMGVQLHVSNNQKPVPLPDSHFDDGTCTDSPDECQFEVIN